MPQMGFDMKEGRIVKWLKHEGDRVNRGEPIAEIETDKAVVEMEAFASGVLRKILVGDDRTVAVGTVVGIIGAPDEAITPSAHSSQGEQPETQQATPVAQEQIVGASGHPESQAPQARDASMGSADERVKREAGAEEAKASPVARRMAEQAGLDLRGIQGTGPQGRIVKEDVERAIAERSGAPAPEHRRPAVQPEAAPTPRPQQPPAQQRTSPPAAPRPTQPAPQAAPVAAGADGLVIPGGLSPMRRAIARNTARSMRETPHFYLTMDIDMSRVVAMRTDMNSELDEQSRISINDFIIRACVKALQKFPDYNVSVLAEGIKRHDKVSISLAIALDNGLIAPGLMDLDMVSIPEIARRSKELVQAARTGKLRPDQYTGGNFAISNLGMYGVTAFTAIITPPNAGALAVGRVEERPVVREGKITTAHMMSVTLSSDHRAVDGAQAAQFMAEVRRLLEKPTALLV